MAKPKKLTYTDLSKEARETIARAVHFLQEEYNYVHENSFCDLTDLMKPKKRVAIAIGMAYESLYRIARTEKEWKNRSPEGQVICEDSRKIIAKLYHFLQKELDILKKSHYSSCCLSFLSNVAKRTAFVTGISESELKVILQSTLIKDYTEITSSKRKASASKKKKENISNKRSKTDFSGEDDDLVIEVNTDIKEPLLVFIS